MSELKQIDDKLQYFNDTDKEIILEANKYLEQILSGEKKWL